MLRRGALCVVLAFALAGTAAAEPKKKQNKAAKQAQVQPQAQPAATPPSKHARVLTAKQKQCRAREKCSLDPRDPPCAPCAKQ